MSPTIPIEAKTFDYVPESLRGIEGAPKFMLRYGTRRDKHTYKAEIAGRGLVSYSDEEIRKAMIEEMGRIPGNSEEAKNRAIDTARRYWAANRALAAEQKLWRDDCMAVLADDPEAELPPAPKIDFDPDEQAWIVGIMQTLQANSTVICNMNKANVRRGFIASEVALSVVLVGVEGFDIERDAEGLVERRSLAALEEWLGDRAEELGVDSLNAGDAYAELRNMAFMAFHLPKETEKNFASLLLATSALSGSQAAAVADASTSPMSEKSTETPSTPADTTSNEKSSTSPCPAGEDSAASPGQTDAP